MAVTREIALREEQQLAFEAFAKQVAADPDSMLHKMILIQAQHAERSDTHETPGALTDAITQALETEVAREYTNPVCRGSFDLGNACRRCERCLDRLAELEGFGIAVGEVSASNPSGDTPIQSLTRKKPLPDIRDIPLTLPRDVNKPFFPGNAPVIGLPNKGYRPTQPQWKVNLVDSNKTLEELTLRQVDRVRKMNTDEVDQRQVALARTKLEEAFYHLNKAIYQPAGSRFDDPLDLSFLQELKG